MPIGMLLFGSASSAASPHYENELRFNYPLYDIVTDRVPRSGSMHAQAPSGVEDSWITGRDYTMECEARFIPDSQSSGQSAVAGSVQWGEFLDAARDKQPFRLVPNTCYPDFYVDNVKLVEPMQGFGSNDALLQRSVKLVMRTSGKDFTEAMRMVMFDYQPGAYINDPTSGSYTRAGTAYYHSKAGVLTSVGANVLRDRHWVKQFATSSGALATTGRMTLLEPASTNIVLRSEELDNATWSKNGVTMTANNLTGPDASTRADSIFETSSDGTHNFQQVGFAIAPDTTVAFSAYLRAGVRSGVRITVASSSGGEIGAHISLTNSCAVPSLLGSGTLTMGPVLESLGSSWYRVSFAGYIGSTSTTWSMVAELKNATSLTSYVGATSAGLSLYGAQVENLPFPTSYMASSATVGTRNADVFARAWSYVPQLTWVYVKQIELGTRYKITGGLVGISASNNPSLFFAANTTTGYAIFSQTSAGVQVQSQISTPPSYGDTVELLGILSTSGAVQIVQSINGGADTTGAGSTAQVLASSWAAATINIGSRGEGNEGIMGIKQVKAGASSTVTSIALARSA